MAFRHFEKNEKKIMMVLAIVAIVAFGIGGANQIVDFFRGISGGRAPVFATVFGEPLHYTAEHAQRANALNYIARMPPFDRIANPAGVSPEWVYPVFHANVKLANEAGIMVPPRQYAEALTQFLRMFRAQQNLPFTGSFNRQETLNDYLNRAELDRRSFEDVFVDVLKVENWLQTIVAAASACPEQMWAMYLMEHRKAGIRYVAIEADAFVDAVGDPDDDALRAHFVANRGMDDPQADRKLFDLPEVATIDYLLVRREAFEADVEIGEEAIEKYYEANKERFRAEPSGDDGGDAPAAYKQLDDVRHEVEAALKRSNAEERMGRAMRNLLTTVRSQYRAQSEAEQSRLTQFVNLVQGFNGRLEAGTVGPFTRKEAADLEPFGPFEPRTLEGSSLPSPLASLAFTGDISKGTEAVLITEAGDMLIVRRVGDVTPSRSPIALDEVRDQVRDHYIKQRSLDKAADMAESIENALKAQRPAAEVLEAYFRTQRETAAGKPVGERPFDIPERVTAEFLRSNREAFKAGVPQPTEEEIAAFYVAQRDVLFRIYDPLNDQPETLYRPLDEVRPRIVSRLVDERVSAAMHAAMSRLLETIRADMEKDVVKPLIDYVLDDPSYSDRVVAGTTEPFGRNEALAVPVLGRATNGQPFALAAAAFSDEPARGADRLLQTPAGEYAIVRRDRRIEARPPESFEAVKDDVLKAFMEERGLRRDWSRVEALLGDIELREPPLFTPEASETDLPQILVRAIFMSRSGDVVRRESRERRTVYVATIDRLVAPTPEEFERDSANRDALTPQIMNHTIEQRLRAYFEYLGNHIERPAEERRR